MKTNNAQNINFSFLNVTNRFNKTARQDVQLLHIQFDLNGNNLPWFESFFSYFKIKQSLLAAYMNHRYSVLHISIVYLISSVNNIKLHANVSFDCKIILLHGIGNELVTGQVNFKC